MSKPQLTSLFNSLNIGTPDSGKAAGSPITQKRSEQIDPVNDKGLKTIAAILLVGVSAIFCTCIWAAISKGGHGIFWSTLGLSCLIAAAALMSGGAFGFLFGIPRSLQKSNSEPAAPSATTGLMAPISSQVQASNRPYSNNTNLEEISDWLTKIIVGVSLTQLPAIERRFHNLSTSLANAFNGKLESGYAYGYVSTLIIFFSICGFLAVYLWAKIYLLQLLTLMENTLFTIKEVVKQSNASNSNKIQIAVLETQLNEFNKQKNRIRNIEDKPEYKPVIETARPEPVKYIDDAQKGRWGGKPFANGYEMSANYIPIDLMDPTHGYQVILTVKSLAIPMPASDVYFLLHDSYYPECIRKITPVNNLASITIPSYEAFTVGALCEHGAVKLELDLNLDPNAPADYKYGDTLKTQEEITIELEKLKSETLTD